MTLEINSAELQKDIAQGVAKGLIPTIMKEFTIELKRAIYPVEIKGDTRAGEMIGLTASALRSRRRTGFYEEGYHFWKKSAKIVMWDRDLLLEQWRQEDGKTVLKTE